MAHRHGGAHRLATGFVGSFVDDPAHGLIVLHGDIDALTVERLGRHVDEFLAGTTLFLMIDAAAVDSYDTELLDLLGRTQHRLGERRGQLRVRGLHPSLLADPAERSGSARESVS